MTIDWWTLGFQTVNVVILVWLLGRFFWRPVAGMIAQRRAAAEQTLAEAAAKRQEADAAMAEIERIRAGFDAERAAILSAAQAAATRLQDAKLAETRRQMETLAAQEVARREKERDDTNKEWAARASRLAVDMAGRLAARLDGQVVLAAFLGWLITEIRALPAATRAALTAAGTPLEVLSATALTPQEQDDVRRQIDGAFGAPTHLSFRTDPALIAGLELSGPHLTVRNSWLADLTEFQAQLQADIAHES